MYIEVTDYLIPFNKPLKHFLKFPKASPEPTSESTRTGIRKETSRF